MTDILSLSLNETKEYVLSLGEPAYRASQLYSWMNKGADFDEMTNLPLAFREKIRESAEYRLPKVKRKLVSKLDGTVKYLFELIDGECIESVLMKYDYGNTICVSSQAGCRMGCRFCASTLKGKNRDLTPSEILGQVIAASKDSGEKIRSVVLMGIGEPLDNYANVLKFIRLVTCEEGLNMSSRHITLSTCGIVPGIYRLAEENLPITLTISLHAYSDEMRQKLMPIAKKYDLSSLSEACNFYFEKTSRRLSFEYTLINGENDSVSDADRLAAFLTKNIKSASHVNLILLNAVKETGLSTPDGKRAKEFASRLQSHGIEATVRRKLGSDINASCGQLRLSETEKDKI